MTESRNPDRLIRAWLDLMPSEAPDRVVSAVLQTVEATPQVRGLRRVGPWRFPMNRLTYAAIALAIVVLGGGAILLTQFRKSDVGPSQAPTASPQPSPTFAAGAPLPNELQARWFGSGRTLAGLDAGAGTTLLLRSAQLSVTQSNAQPTSLLGALVSIVEGRLQAQKGTGPTLCGDADVGSYAYSLSASGETLTISDPHDPCAIRKSTLVGTWWRIDCKGGQTTCLGKMDAGTYGSQYIRPRLDGAAWAPKFGGVTFTVPEGWANNSDWPEKFGLGEASAFEAAPNGEGSPQMWLLANVVASAQGASRCSATPAASVEANPDAVVAYLRQIPGLVVGKSHLMTVDGFAGSWVDLSVDPVTIKRCPGSGDEVVEFSIFSGQSYAIRTGGTWRELFLGLGGELALVSLEAPDQATLDAFWTKALPIIQSFHFE